MMEGCYKEAKDKEDERKGYTIRGVKCLGKGIVRLRIYETRRWRKTAERGKERDWEERREEGKRRSRGGKEGKSGKKGSERGGKDEKEDKGNERKIEKRRLDGQVYENWKGFEVMTFVNILRC